MIKNIYLAGGMTGLSYEEANNWRNDICDWVQKITDNKVKVFNPCEHFSFEEVEDGTITDREAMDFDLFNLNRSDIVILNFNAKYSIGTAAEMGIAYNKRIPILGLNEKGTDLHPWQRDMCQKIFTDTEDLLLYLIKHYL